LHDGPVAADEGARLVPRVAEDHRDVPRLRRSIGPERMAVQMQHIQRRAEIETAPEHRIGRLQAFEQALIREGKQGSAAVFRQSEMVEQGARPPPAIAGPLRSDLLAAHRRGSVEETIGCGHRHQRRDLGAAARLAEDHHAVRVPAEGPDMLADPFERADQVELPRIAAVAETLTERCQPAIAEQVEPVIDRDDHHIALFGKLRPMRQRVSDRAPIVGPAMKIDHHRAARGRMGIRRPDVEEQAVLAHCRGHRIALGAQRTELRRGRGRGRNRLAHRAVEPRRAGIADAEKCGYPAIDHAAIGQSPGIAATPCRHRRGRKQCAPCEAPAQSRAAGHTVSG
jgi:hypothetical protein